MIRKPRDYGTLKITNRRSTMPDNQTKAQAVIDEAINSLALAKTMEAEAKSLKKAASETLMTFFIASGTKSIDSEKSQGTVTYVAPTESKKFDKDKAAQELLYYGVSADAIEESYAKATTTTQRAGYVSFKPYKK